MASAFFDKQATLFWGLHLGGWTAYAVLNYLIGIELDERPGDYFILSLLYALGGTTITFGLRWLFRLIWDLRPLPILLIGGLGSLVASFVFTGYRALASVWFYGAYQWARLSILEGFSLWELSFSFYVVGTWSGLYFGIRYYRTVQEQRERLLRATGMAHEAQLKMLQYQLNPHFLFNTLNAISTLVLENDRQAANDMLTRLSAFLRHSLHSDPMQRVTVREELEAMERYLSIERVRFDDRLQVDIEIEPQAYAALVPTLVLQPLIENAIKHAIAANPKGGTIGIAAGIEGGKLYLRVTDTGPGTPVPVPADSEGPSGVGLNNTRKRLLALYGDRHELVMEPLEPAGLSVTVCIPFECNGQEHHPRADRR
jgi:signal transduction histidine kinase